MTQWLFWIITFGACLWLEWLTVHSTRNLRVGADEGAGVQKFHSHSVSRLGGLGVFVALSAGLLAMARVTRAEIPATVSLIVCLLPAFSIGLLEDVTRKVGVLARLTFTMFAAALGWWLLDARLTRLDLPMIDHLLAAAPLGALLLTVLAAAGLAHAVNIIDGYNGLSGFYCTAACLALAYVAHQVGDVFVMRAAFLASAAVCGFLVLNYPYGRIFLGDAGAYLLGFLIGELSILLVARNPQVSPWFPMLVAVYPVWETLFSIYRKKFLRGTSPGDPDGLHLHMLVYKRLVKKRFSADAERNRLLRNSATSPYLWTVTALSVGPAVLLWNHERLLMAAVLVFVAFYLWLYWSIVRFRTPAAVVLQAPPAGGPVRAIQAPENT